jgi:hypothetical protein
MAYSSKAETQKHIYKVLKFIDMIHRELIDRQIFHDSSKLESPEVELFDIYTPKLVGCTYGSGEYKQFLLELKPALDHHYAENRHHPEHFENGVRGMNLVDIVEMFCDWYAATKRHKDGDIMKSIAINQERFRYSDDLRAVFENTYRDIFEKAEEVRECRVCRVCGCTDDDCRQCIEKTGEPCHWVEDDLCSACAGENNDTGI